MLAGDQVAVTHRVRFETTRYDEVGSRNLLRFILDPERLNSLANKVVGIGLFGVSKVSLGLSIDEEFFVYFRLQENAGRMVENGCHFSCFVGLACQSMDAFVVVVRVHRCLSTNEEYGIVIGDLELIDRP